MNILNEKYTKLISGGSCCSSYNYDYSDDAGSILSPSSQGLLAAAMVLGGMIMCIVMPCIY